MDAVNENPFYAGGCGATREKIRCPYCTAGNIAKQCNFVCYNNWEEVSAEENAQPFLARVNLTAV